MALTSLDSPLELCTQGDVEAVLSADGLTLDLDDDETGANSATELTYLTHFIRWASARLRMYLGGRYDDADLSKSWAVNEMAAIMVAVRCSRRRGNPASESLIEAYGETMELVRQIKAYQMSLEDVAERTSGSISWRNIRHSRHTLRRSRVERPISEGTPPQGKIVPDLAADYVGPELYWL